MLLDNFAHTNGGFQLGGFSIPDESYLPYSPASISSSGTSPGWAGQNMYPSSHFGEQVQVSMTLNSSLQRQAPIPTIVGVDTLPPCTVANIQPATAAPAKQGAKPKKPPGVKRARTAYLSSQLKTLEEEFSKDPYVRRNQRIFLAETLHLSEKQIKIWYQNRRMKLKKESISSSGSTAKPLRPKKKDAATTRTPKRSRRTSKSSSMSSQTTNSPPPFDACRASAMTPPDEVRVMMHVPRPNFGYGDTNNYPRSHEAWTANGRAVHAFAPQQQPIQWQNVDAGYAGLPITWHNQQFTDVTNNAPQYDAAQYQGPSTSASSSNNHHSVQEPNIFSENYQLPVLGDLSAWLDTPSEEILHPSFTSL